MSAEQGTEEWLYERYGLPTASRASDLITSTGTPSKSMAAYADELAAERYAGKPLDTWRGNASTERGHELEPVARAAYEFATDSEVELSGFILSADERYGCSPDGLVGDDGLLEIKCREMKGHIATLVYSDKHGKPPTTNIAQCWFQMLVMDRAWCDLFYWHPDLPAINHRITADTIPPGLIEQIDACIARRDKTLEILRRL